MISSNWLAEAWLTNPLSPHCQQRGQPDPLRRHRVECVLTNQKHAQRSSNTALRDLCDQRQAITACLHRRLEAINEHARMSGITGGITVCCQRLGLYVITLYALNVDDDNMKMHFVAQPLGNSVGRASVLDTSRVCVVRGIDRINDGRLVAIDQTIVVRYITIIQLI